MPNAFPSPPTPPFHTPSFSAAFFGNARMPLRWKFGSAISGTAHGNCTSTPLLSVSAWKY
jgi:hypothetical protein